MMDFPAFLDFRSIVFAMPISNRFYALLGVIVESLFLLVLFACIVTVVFVWKVSRDALVFLVLICVLTVAGSCFFSFVVVFFFFFFFFFCSSVVYSKGNVVLFRDF
jgi:hypothetical protein